MQKGQEELILSKSQLLLVLLLLLVGSITIIITSILTGVGLSSRPCLDDCADSGVDVAKLFMPLEVLHSNFFFFLHLIMQAAVGVHDLCQQSHVQLKKPLSLTISWNGSFRTHSQRSRFRFCVFEYLFQRRGVRVVVDEKKRGLGRGEQTGAERFRLVFVLVRIKRRVNFLFVDGVRSDRGTAVPGAGDVDEEFREFSRKRGGFVERSRGKRYRFYKSGVHGVSQFRSQIFEEDVAVKRKNGWNFHVLPVLLLTLTRQ